MLVPSWIDAWIDPGCPPGWSASPRPNRRWRPRRRPTALPQSRYGRRGPASRRRRPRSRSRRSKVRPPPRLQRARPQRSSRRCRRWPRSGSGLFSWPSSTEGRLSLAPFWITPEKVEDAPSLVSVAPGSSVVGDISRAGAPAACSDLRSDCSRRGRALRRRPHRPVALAALKAFAAPAFRVSGRESRWFAAGVRVGPGQGDDVGPGDERDGRLCR